jgi:hypothetical protein
MENLVKVVSENALLKNSVYFSPNLPHTPTPEEYCLDVSVRRMI